MAEDTITDIHNETWRQFKDKFNVFQGKKAILLTPLHTMKNVVSYFEAKKDDVYAFALETPLTTIGHLPDLEGVQGEADVFAKVFAMKYNNPDDVNETYDIIIISGLGELANRVVKELFCNIPEERTLSLMHIPEGIRSDILAFPDIVTTPNRIPLYNLDMAHLSTLLQQSARTNSTKVGSTYLWLFPHLIPWARLHFEVIEGEEAEQTINCTAADLSTKQGKDVFKGLSMAYSIMYAYTRGDMFRTQLDSRMKAALASTDETNIEAQIYVNFLSLESDNLANRDSAIIDLVGRGIAYTVDGVYDIKSSSGNLMPVAQYIEKYASGEWAGVVIPQVRLVFQSVMITSVKFGADLFEVAGDFIAMCGADFEQQCLRMKNVLETIRASPFINLQKTVPELLRVEQFALLILTGIEWYKLNLTDPLAKAQMEKYQMKSITGHIKSRSQEQACIKLAKTLPPDGVVALAMIIENCSKENAVNALIGEGQDQIDMLLAHCKSKNSTSEWYTWQKTRIAKQSDDLWRPRIEERVRTQRERILSINDNLIDSMPPNVQQAKRARLLDWKRKLNVETSKIEMEPFNVEEAGPGIESEVAHKIFDDYASVFLLLSQGPGILNDVPEDNE